jgi:Fe-S oxidoreductase
MSQLEPVSSQARIEINDEKWRLLGSLTGGAAAPCYQCGVCTAICPWSRLRGQTTSVRQMMRRAQLGLPGDGEELWLCTACGQCEASCPRGIDITRVIRGLRNLAWRERRTPTGLPAVLWSLYWNNNPWAQPPSSRALWAKDLDLPSFDPEVHEILLYVGCTASYDRRSQKIARAVVRLLEAARVSFGYLGEDEPCCGEAALSLGHQPFFSELAGRALDVFREKRVSHLVTISPHCFDSFKHHYPVYHSGDQVIQIRHYSQYLNQLIEDGRLKWGNTIEKRLTIHDPCILSRRDGETDILRTILKSIEGLAVVEMEHHGADALCCGGGGGRMFLETKAQERFADLRLDEALECQADIMATACPFCISCLEDSAKSSREKIEVLDLAEIAVMALA